MSDEAPHFYDFGPFRMDAVQHLLMCNGTEVALTPKAFDTLMVLVRNHNRVAGKDELLASVWPDTFVEEATLAQNVFTLRKILRNKAVSSDEYIRTIPKRGYRFVAMVTEVSEDSNATNENLRVPQLDTASRKSTAADKAINSIAVLPIINASADPKAESFSDGLMETIVSSLSLLPELRVKACSTVLRYKDQEVDPQEAGRTLGVRAVLIGRILRCRKSMIIRMELVDVANGWQLWGKQYQEKLSDIFRTHQRIARNISENFSFRDRGRWNDEDGAKMVRNVLI